MLSITGCTLDQFAELMKGLGYAAERGERPRAKPPAVKPAEAPTTQVDAASEAMDATAPEHAGAPPAAAPDAPPVAEVEPAGPGESAAAMAGPDASSAGTSAVSCDPAPAEGVASVETPASEPDRANADADGLESAPEMESYYVFKIAPRRPPRDRGQRRGPPRRSDAPGAARGDEAKAGEAGGEAAKPKRGPRPDGPRKTEGVSGAPKGKGPKRGGKKPQRDEAPRAFAAAPPRRREEKVDEDNPFSVLRQLKDRM
jgi:hypothetical protein